MAKEENKVTYVKKPEFKRYREAIRKSGTKVEREQLYKVQKELEKKYAKQHARIALGDMPTEREAKIKRIKEKIISGFKKGLKRTAVTGRKFRLPKSRLPTRRLIIHEPMGGFEFRRLHRPENVSNRNIFDWS